MKNRATAARCANDFKTTVIAFPINLAQSLPLLTYSISKR